MTILSTIASLGTNAIVGSGILKVYSREKALKLVGTGEAILKDSVALEKLTSTEIAALKEAITKIKKELYAIRNVPDAVETIVNTKATVFFNKFPSLKTELDILTEVERYRFYDYFVNISEEFVLQIEKTPDFIVHWDILTDAQKLSVKLDKIGYYRKWYIIRVNEEAVQLRNSGLWQDIRRGIANTENANKSINEMESLVDLKIQYKLDLVRSLYFEAGDARCFAGQFEGKSIDVMGRITQQALDTQWKFKPTRAMFDFENSMVIHFKKITNPSSGVPALDILVIDLKGFNNNIKAEILNYIEVQYPTYVNPSHSDFQKLIILNKE